jgi:hypothetical protein
MLLLNISPALAEDLHQIWNIPYGIGQDELRGLLNEQMGVDFDNDKAVKRTQGARTIYMNTVGDTQWLGYPLHQFGVVMNDSDGDGTAQYEGLLMLFMDTPLGELGAPGDVDQEKIRPSADRLSALIRAMTDAYGEPTFSQYVLHLNDMSHKEQPIRDIEGVGKVETWAKWFTEWDSFLVTVDWGNVNLLCNTVKRYKWTYVQAMITFSDKIQ